MFDLSAPSPRYAAALSREISHTRSVYSALLLEAQGVRVVNSAAVIETCGDKVRTSLALLAAGLPVPETFVALTPEAALERTRTFRLPIVLKPLAGSWGRLGARLSDHDGVAAVLEHRAALPNPQARIVYAQEYVDKPGRDIRVYVFGDDVVCATYKYSSEWRTNSARGGTSVPCPVTGEISTLARAAARAVGGGAFGIDLLESRDGRLYVNEVNHTPEFRGALAATRADVAGLYVDFLLERIAQDGETIDAAQQASYQGSNGQRDTGSTD